MHKLMCLIKYHNIKKLFYISIESNSEWKRIVVEYSTIELTLLFSCQYKLKLSILKVIKERVENSIILRVGFSAAGNTNM